MYFCHFNRFYIGPYDFWDVENADGIAESNHKKRNLLYKVECHRIWKVGNYT